MVKKSLWVKNSTLSLSWDKRLREIGASAYDLEMAYRLTQYRLHLAWLTVPEARRYGVLHSSTHVYMSYLYVRTFLHNMIQYTCIISTTHTNIAKSKPGILQVNQQHIMATSCQMSICRCLSAKHATTTPSTFILNIKIKNVHVQISIRPIFYLFLFSLPCSFQADGIYIIYQMLFLERFNWIYVKGV